MLGIDRNGRPLRVSVLSDTAFLYFWIFAEHLVRLGDSTSVISVGLAVGWLIFAILVMVVGSMMLQAFLRRHFAAVRLSATDAPQLHAMLEGLVVTMSLPQAPSIFWIPTDLTRAAKAIATRKWAIYVTGGFVAHAIRDPEQTRLVLAHELAHLRNNDSRLYLYVPYIFLSALLISPDEPTLLYEQAQPYERGCGAIIAIIAIIVVELLVLRFLARRREYFADLAAINLASSIELYVTAMTGPNIRHTSRLHPPKKKRLRAIQVDSPVLRASWFLVIFSTLGVLTSVFYVVDITDTPRFLLDWHIALAVIGAVVPGTILLSELRKGFAAKRPMTSAEIAAHHQILPQTRHVQLSP